VLVDVPAVVGMVATCCAITVESVILLPEAAVASIHGAERTSVTLTIHHPAETGLKDLLAFQFADLFHG
jgi:hypothetical protein